jgi:hypothetical protein
VHYVSDPPTKFVNKWYHITTYQHNNRTSQDSDQIFAPSADIAVMLYLHNLGRNTYFDVIEVKQLP